MPQDYTGNPYGENTGATPEQIAYGQQQEYQRRQQAAQRQQYMMQQQRQQAYIQQVVAAQVDAARKKGRVTAFLAGLVCLVLGALVALLLGRFLWGGASSELKSVSGALTEAELSTVVGTYVYDGATYTVTAREAILGSESLASASNGDGTYKTPSSDMVLAYARNQILAKLVADSGITVTEDEVYAYALDVMGSADSATVAAYLGMETEQAWNAVRAACAASKLKDLVVGSAGSVAAPAYPADGNTELGRPEYADYIMNLLGSNWDWTTMNWANTDNPYYTALQNSVFGQGSASYEAAMLAYNVAVSLTASGSDAMSVWTSYVNEYLDKGAIAIYTLRA